VAYGRDLLGPDPPSVGIGAEGTVGPGLFVLMEEGRVRSERLGGGILSPIQTLVTAYRDQHKLALWLAARGSPLTE
jgi:hypothetical protein